MDHVIEIVRYLLIDKKMITLADALDHKGRSTIHITCLTQKGVIASEQTIRNKEEILRLLFTYCKNAISLCYTEYKGLLPIDIAYDNEYKSLVAYLLCEMVEWTTDISTLTNETEIIMENFVPMSEDMDEQISKVHSRRYLWFPTSQNKIYKIICF